jgi:uncharacterized membrane protein
MDYSILEFLILYLHFFSSVLWWGLTFFVIFILRPITTKTSYSFLLLRIHQFVLPISTISITSGIALTFININFDPNRLFNSLWSYMLILGGLFSIPIYLVILFQSTKRNITLKLSNKITIKNTHFLPYLLFALLSSTITIMIFVTHLFS